MSNTFTNQETASFATHAAVEDVVQQREDWALRRQRGIPNNRKLFVLTCMDERVDIDDALQLELGDAHIFRNAGGVVTDDAIRSAALTTNFFQTTEIVVVQHTDCGMLLHSGDDIVAGFEKNLDAAGKSVDGLSLDPALPDLKLPREKQGDWIKAFDDVDASVERQIEYLRQHPLIPDGTLIHGYVYEVESGHLRRPHQSPAAVSSKSPAKQAK
jgi:carbonic anhydrase